jgi:hypothetical protein
MTIINCFFYILKKKLQKENIPEIKNKEIDCGIYYIYLNKREKS